MLGDSDIEAFREIYRTEFGKEINKEDAYEKGIKLLRLVELVYKPITLEQYKRLQQHKKEIGENKTN